MKVGDAVQIIDQGMQMLMKFAPPNTVPINQGVILEVDGDEFMVVFPIGMDDPKKHSQVAPYNKYECLPLKSPHPQVLRLKEVMSSNA
jgi:hypothetical protein